MKTSLTAELLQAIRQAPAPIGNREAREALDLAATRYETTRVSKMLADLIERGGVVAIQGDAGGRVYVANPDYVLRKAGRPRTTPEAPPKPAKATGPGPAKVNAARAFAGAKLLLSHSVREAEKGVREAEKAMRALLGKDLSDANLARQLAGAINAHWPGGRPSMPLELRQLTAEAARRFHSPLPRELKPQPDPPVRCALRLTRARKLNSRVCCEVCGPFSPRRNFCAAQILEAAK